MPTPSDKPLRDRVKLLGQLLGQTLRDREGRNVLDAVETLRQGFIELCSQSDLAPDIRERLLRFIAALNPEMLNHVVREMCIRNRCQPAKARQRPRPPATGVERGAGSATPAGQATGTPDAAGFGG